jgi:hypothetical protein
LPSQNRSGKTTLELPGSLILGCLKEADEAIIVRVYHST